MNELKNRCVYRTSFFDKKCKAGVEYDSMGAAWADRPCSGRWHAGLGLKPRNPRLCPKYKSMTDEQLKAEQKSFEDALNRVTKTFKATEKTRSAMKAEWRATRKGITRRIKCPQCGSDGFTLSCSAYNGRIAMSCTTPGCHQSME